MDEMWINPPPHLDAALKIAKDPSALVKRLLEITARTSVASSLQGGAWTYAVMSNSSGSNEELSLNKDLVLSGPSLERVQKIYSIVRGIETTLSESLFLPPEMRGEEVRLFCSHHNITPEDLTQITSVWRKT